MAETPYTGLTASVKLGANPSGVNIGYISGCKLDLDKDIIEIIAFGMTYKEKVPAIKDWTMSIDGTAAFDAAGSQSQLLDAFETGALLVFGIYLNPTTYFEGSGYLKSLSIDAAPDDKISIASEVAGSGAIVFAMPAGTALLTFVCTDHATAGATQIETGEITPAGGNSLKYRVNVALPAVGAVLAAPWTTVALDAAIPAVNGDVITVAEVVTATSVVVKRGHALAVVA